MKKLIYFASLIFLISCSPSERRAEDLTDPSEESISPNQIITKEEQLKKDSTTTDILGQDTAAQKVDR